MVTSIQDLRALGTVQEVELPGWNENETVTFKLGRPSLMLMVRSGKIPNGLLATAQQLFSNANALTNNDFSDVIKVMFSIVEATLVEPSYEELTNAGIELTDEQLMLIFNYSQQGVRALEQFRKQRANANAAGDIEAAKSKAKRSS